MMLPLSALFVFFPNFTGYQAGYHHQNCGRTEALV
jgi:hypothetical protein